MLNEQSYMSFWKSLAIDPVYRLGLRTNFPLLYVTESYNISEYDMFPSVAMLYAPTYQVFNKIHLTMR